MNMFQTRIGSSCAAPVCRAEGCGGNVDLPAGQHCPMFKNRSCLASVRRLDWPHWEHSQFPQTKPSGRTPRPHGSVFRNLVSRDVGLVSALILNVYSS